MSENQESLQAQNKDIDVLRGFERKTLKESPLNILEHQVSVNEAFDTGAKKEVDPFTESSRRNTAGGMESRWSKYKNFCLASFQTRASDFAKSDVSVLFSRRVRDRLAELAVTSDEAAQITLMQQNEERLRSKIAEQAKVLEKLHQDGEHWQMIETVSTTCKLLSNTKSPQFYPAQFIMVLELVEIFGKMVYKRIAEYPTSKADFLKDPNGTTQVLCLNWSMILSRTSQLLPRLLLQTTFLKCIEFHPFKTFDDSVQQVVNGIHGLGSGSAGIFVRAFLIYTIFSLKPNYPTDVFIPLFTSYVRHLLHLKNGSFKRQYSNLPDYTFEKYVETHKPALSFFIQQMVTIGDSPLIKQALEEFYSIGEPSSFILSVFLEELEPKFVAKNFKVILHIIDHSDSVIPRPELIYKLITSLIEAPEIEGVLDVMNLIWTRMKEFKSIDDFIYVAAPLTKYIAKFCSPHYINLFLSNVVSLLKQNFAAREMTYNYSQGVRSLTKKLTTSVMDCIFSTVKSGQNFHVVLNHISSIVALMDFLDESSLVEVSRFILQDVAAKPFPLNDPLCIRILLELSQILFQSLSVLSPPDIVAQTNKTIEWFLYHVDFGTNIEAHLNFLLSARTAFPTSNSLLAAIAEIALRLCTQAVNQKVSNIDVVTRSLLAFAFVTVPSLPDPLTRAKLYIDTSNVALIAGVTSFAFSSFEEFTKSVKDVPPTPELFDVLEHALTLLLVLPAPPGVDPFESVRNLIKAVMNISWKDEEPIVFALESIIIVGHMLRTEFVLRIPNVDSNDVLFAGNPEYIKRGLSVSNQMLAKFVDMLSNYRKKGVVVQKKNVPALAVKAISSLADVYVCDKALIRKLADLAEMLGDGAGDEIMTSTGAHLEKAFNGVELGQRFVAKYFSSE
ncbi:hypothetical protein TVAG_246640 [Trichomonas vaginalis G3]|uniref:Uncharacterized protein n=1 Tax=Trichomonas vaginalis (strain ATCC PRA-98 / G3) TaxID=412133 RepID=A2DKK3_TRIV3|nr:esophageal cancer associated protein family [Trichomonas vaginalis G3]EAY18986.1 hypothetical protein TVAG_246640 [Trichomonas vaginalis G3]KAI5521221.1 esophageal cancer associated protein family [Trichomonas vaginalis G3]|eukprot:XP_001579972.1 hypothetical protein [Trichomonas vaginalis G3]